MSEATHPDAPLKEAAFPNNPGEGKPTNPRNDVIDEMSERYEVRRVEELHEAMDADPGLKANQEAIERGMAAENAKNMTDEQAAAAVAAEAAKNDGAATRAPLHEAPADPAKPALPKELQDDPLAEYIVMQEGRPMMKMKVDGEIVYRDLDDVRTTSQKHEAADRRLQQASEWSKDLQQREANLKAKETAPVQQSQQERLSPLPERTDVDDLDIDAVSKDIVSSMFTGTEEEAATKLADTLRRVRGSGGQPQPQIDAGELVNQAKHAAREEMEQDHYKSTVTTAWNTFTEDFEDVMEDDEAFAFADSLTGKLEKEHPDWEPAQVMMEAGTRARAVVIEGKKPHVDPPLPPADADRQANKENLTPIPQHGNAIQDPVEEEKPQTASEVLAEIRKSRNQPM